MQSFGEKVPPQTRKPIVGQSQSFDNNNTAANRFAVFAADTDAALGRIESLSALHHTAIQVTREMSQLADMTELVKEQDRQLREAHWSQYSNRPPSQDYAMKELCRRAEEGGSGVEHYLTRVGCLLALVEESERREVKAISAHHGMNNKAVNGLAPAKLTEKGEASGRPVPSLRPVMRFKYRPRCSQHNVVAAAAPTVLPPQQALLLENSKGLCGNNGSRVAPPSITACPKQASPEKKAPVKAASSTKSPVNGASPVFLPSASLASGTGAGFGMLEPGSAAGPALVPPSPKVSEMGTGTGFGSTGSALSKSGRAPSATTELKEVPVEPKMTPAKGPTLGAFSLCSAPAAHPLNKTVSAAPIPSGKTSLGSAFSKPTDGKDTTGFSKLSQDSNKDTSKPPTFGTLGVNNAGKPLEDKCGSTEDKNTNTKPLVTAFSFQVPPDSNTENKTSSKPTSKSAEEARKDTNKPSENNGGATEDKNANTMALGANKPADSKETGKPIDSSNTKPEDVATKVTEVCNPSTFGASVEKPMDSSIAQKKDKNSDQNDANKETIKSVKEVDQEGNKHGENKPSAPATFFGFKKNTSLETSQNVNQPVKEKSENNTATTEATTNPVKDNSVLGALCVGVLGQAPTSASSKEAIGQPNNQASGAASTFAQPNNQASGAASTFAQPNNQASGAASAFAQPQASIFAQPSNQCATGGAFAQAQPPSNTPLFGKAPSQFGNNNSVFANAPNGGSVFKSPAPAQGTFGTVPGGVFGKPQGAAPSAFGVLPSTAGPTFGGATSGSFFGQPSAFTNVSRPLPNTSAASAFVNH